MISFKVRPILCDVGKNANIKSTYEVLIASECPDDRVPDLMQVSDAVNVRVDPLFIATAIALWVFVIDLSSGVKRLVKVTDIVDDKAKCERPLITLIREALCNPINVYATTCALAPQEGCEVAEGAKTILRSHGKVVFANVTSFIEVGLINEVPVALPAVTLALDVISESGTLSEGMVTLVRGEGWVGALKSKKLVDGGRERIRSLLLENSFGPSGDCERKRMLESGKYSLERSVHGRQRTMSR